jgi:hypothetical protein
VNPEFQDIEERKKEKKTEKVGGRRVPLSQASTSVAIVVVIRRDGHAQPRRHWLPHGGDGAVTADSIICTAFAAPGYGVAWVGIVGTVIARDAPVAAVMVREAVVLVLAFLAALIDERVLVIGAESVFGGFFNIMPGGREVVEW